MQPKPDLYDIEEAAVYVRLSPYTLNNFRSRPGMVGPRFVKLGERVYYLKEDLDAWIESRAYKTTAEYQKAD
jgi:predicted DNA-binding transcriptional regulator AlpA